VPLLLGMVFVYSVEHVAHACTARAKDESGVTDEVTTGRRVHVHHHDHHHDHHHAHSSGHKHDAEEGWSERPVEIDSVAPQHPSSLAVDDADVSKVALSGSHRWDPVAWTVLIGDGAHNIVDGLIIGSAFTGCSSSLGWAVTVAIVLHELPSEISDYIILRRAGLSVKQACLANLASSLTAFIGLFVSLGIGSVDSSLHSVLLSFASGIFLFLGATDVMPELIHCHKTDAMHLMSPVLGMLIGMGAVYLTVMNHTHGCGDDHDGHDH